jgi:anti-sigma regulatory factor (Ser/Thr protein kinase)
VRATPGDGEASDHDQAAPTWGFGLDAVAIGFMDPLVDPTAVMRVERLIDGGAQAPREARSVVAEMDSLLGWRREDARIIVSELTTNAWRHGHARDTRPIRLTVEHRDGGLRMEIHDQGAGFDAPRGPDRRPPERPGWGLRIVRGLADAWGIRRSPRGTCVWALIRRPDGSEPGGA